MLHTHQSTRARGRTVLELTIASTMMIIVLATAVPAFIRIAKAGGEGSTRTVVESDNRAALIKIARELQNTSLTLLNGTGGTVFAVTVDTANQPTRLTFDGGLLPDDGTRTAALEGVTAGDAVGGPNTTTSTACGACKLGQTTGHTCGLADGVKNDGGVYGQTPLNPLNAGSGRRGVTKSGRARSLTASGFTFGTAASRPRARVFPNNSILSFQKVVGYTISGSGEPILTWSTNVQYRVQGRSLVRIQDGVTQTVSRNCTAFFVEQTDAGTVVISIVSERRASATGEITTQSNQYEVRPKN